MVPRRTKIYGIETKRIKQHLSELSGSLRIVFRALLVSYKLIDSPPYLEFFFNNYLTLLINLI
jgi:hypothetical protein